MGRELVQQLRQRLPFVDEDAHVPLWLGQGERGLQIGLRFSCRALPPQRQAAEDAQLDRLAQPARAPRRR